MNVIPGPVRCRQCDAVLGAQPWNVCVLCVGVFCTTHLIERNGVTTCRESEPERLAREAESTVKDTDVKRVVALLMKDVTSTVGQGVDHIVTESAARHRLFVHDIAPYEQAVVDDVQQRRHDEFIDTTWPACPSNRNHPLWFSGGNWRCEQPDRCLPALVRFTVLMSEVGPHGCSIRLPSHDVRAAEPKARSAITACDMN
jgi:hypothetical protein